MATVRFTPEIFRVQRHGGVSRYVVELHRELRRQGHDSLILAGLHRNALLGGVDGVLGVDLDQVRPARLRQAVTKAVDPLLVRAWARTSGPPVVAHKTYFDGRPPRGGPRWAITVHDMIHERFPGQVGTSDATATWKRRWCFAADVVFTNSQHTKDDLLDHIRLDPAKVVVTPLGVVVHRPASIEPPFGDEPFVLSVGDRRAEYKNWPTLLEAIRGIDGGRLACFGPPASAADREMVEQAGLRGRVAFVSGDDRALAGWYRAAAVLAYPSRHEGFGLPPIEAMAHGLPVVAGDAGAIPETIGDAGLRVDPDDVDALAHALDSVLSDGSLAEDLAERGRRRAEGFTWERTAQATLAGYELAVA